MRQSTPKTTISSLLQYIFLSAVWEVGAFILIMNEIRYYSRQPKPAEVASLVKWNDKK